jgi:hypothetical protein
MGPQPSVPHHRYALPIWARRPRTAVILPALLLVLAIPGAAHAGRSGGMPSPDPSNQISPDPAPSGGVFGRHGTGGQAPPQQTSTPRTSPPAGSTAPAAPVPTKGVTSPGSSPSRSHRRHTVATPRRTHSAHPGRHVKKPASARPLPALFVSSLNLALHAPISSASASAHAPGDALVLAAIALLLLVFTGLLVVRTSAQVLGRERPT